MGRAIVATIRFTFSGMERRVTVDMAPEVPLTLLAVARAYKIPIPFNCGSGDCGSCRVQVETIAAGSEPVAPLTDVERLMLPAAERLTTEDIADAERLGISPKARLACQYRLGDEEIAVSFDTDLGGK